MSAYNHLEYAALDVAKTGRTFKQINTRYMRAPKRMSKMAPANAANELYFAARKAWRLALAQEAK